MKEKQEKKMRKNEEKNKEEENEANRSESNAARSHWPIRNWFPFFPSTKLRPLPDFARFLKIFSGILGFTGFDQVLLGLTGFYWVLLGFTGI